MRLFFKPLALITILLVFGQLAVFSQPEDGPPRRGPRNHHERMWYGNTERMRERLDLSQEQVDKIEKINRENFDRMRSVHKQLRPLRDRLRQELLVREINLNQVRERLTDISKLEVELRYLQILHGIEIEKVLTPDQRATLEQERKAMRRRPRHDE